LKSLRALGLEDAIIPIIVPGTIFVICRKSPPNARFSAACV
jgi:hypothetical protein